MNKSNVTLYILLWVFHKNNSIAHYEHCLKSMCTHKQLSLYIKDTYQISTNIMMLKDGASNICINLIIIFIYTTQYIKNSIQKNYWMWQRYPVKIELNTLAIFSTKQLAQASLYRENMILNHLAFSFMHWYYRILVIAVWSRSVVVHENLICVKLVRSVEVGRAEWPLTPTTGSYFFFVSCLFSLSFFYLIHLFRA